MARLENQQIDHQLTGEDFRRLVEQPRAALSFEALVHQLDEGVVVLRRDGSVRFINPAALRIYGLQSIRQVEDFVRRTATLPWFDAQGELLAPDDLPLARTFRDGIAFSRQVFGTDLPGGGRRWMQASARLLRPDAPVDSDVLVSFSDITEERSALERLIYQANHDPLTGLPNRAFVLRRITEALATADRGRLRAVLFIDLDDLKTTNDTLGHEAGDALLNAAATRLRQAVGSDDVVGRHGGDEFVLLLFGSATAEELDGLVRRLRVRLAEPVAIADTAIPIRASVGVVEVDRDDRRSAEEILRDADRAMYKAKRASRGYKK